MMPDLCGSSLLLSLPDDILSVITKSLSPRDVCSLGLSCRDLNAVVSSDKVWFPQCDKLRLISCNTLIEWRKGISSYNALCRFLVNIHPLIGIWVHQNPELGNVVYVMPGFLSIIGCRIIPQEVGPLGLEEGPILWTPVFEILCNQQGSPMFFLHGREKGVDYVYPGLLKSVDKSCNVLLLEVEPRHHRNNGGKLAYSKSFAHEVGKLSRSDSGLSKSQRVVGQRGGGVGMSFSRLGFADRRRLLDTVTSQVKLNVPDSANLLLFPHSRIDEVDSRRDLVLLHERRTLLLQMYKRGGAKNNNNDFKSSSDLIPPLNPTELGSSEVCKSLECYHAVRESDKGTKTLSGFLKNGLKQMMGKSSSSSSSNCNSNRDFQKKNESSNKHLHLHDFIRSGDTIGLSFRATTMKLSSYRAWPNMHDNRFALYKLPMRAPHPDHEYSGLYGGSFGWPPGRPSSQDKPGKALFFILISYEESEGQQLLIGTKILEGTSYVLHPNGSAMFIVNVGQPSSEIFPFDNNEEMESDYCCVNDVEKCFVGEGIANGYGFRYPGSKPGTLFVVGNGLLVFVWKESRAVLTLQRVKLDDLLRKGERVPSLSPVSNFAYLTKTYSNVFSGFSNSSRIEYSGSREA